jgi:hypothetical protein
VVLAGCGDGDGRSEPDEAVRQWADAVNDRDWRRACELSTDRAASCASKLRSNFAAARLDFQGRATGGGVKPGESYFSLRQTPGGTVFVTAVPDGDTYAVRLEAVAQSIK